MIVSIGGRGVLELYWRHPVSMRPNRYKAIHFVSDFCHDFNKTASIHAFLSTHGMKRSSDAAAREYLAGKIATGDILVLRQKGELRWPGTRLLVEPLSPRILLLACAAAQLVGSEGRARDWLQKAEDADLRNVFRTLWIGYGRSALLAPSREVCFGEIEKLLDRGELVPVFHPLSVHLDTVIRRAPATTVPAPAPENLPPPETDTFESSHAGNEQAAALLGASKEGLAVCEVCNRGRESRARSERKPRHWIEIQLVMEDGIPVPDVEYQVTLPNGTIMTGYLDANGSARLDNIDQSGNCQVSFPGLDRNEWKLCR